MTEMHSGPATVRFEDYEVDLRAGELYKHGLKIKLAGLPFKILAMFLERPGDVLTREELRNKLWPADTFVDFEHSLNTAIRKLRGALGDSAKKPRLVETLARRGYRFLGIVEKIEGAPQPAEAPAHAWVGQVAKLGDEKDSSFVLVPVDEETMREKEKLEAANDDLGVALLTASEKLLLVASGTEVRVLEARESFSGCRVRILEGQYFGQTAFVPRKYLRGLSQSVAL